MKVNSDKIKNWKPFLYIYTDIDGKKQKIKFTCPKCGGHNCIKLGEIDKYNFWSGHYKCTDCGETKENGKPICYYSNAFTKNKIKNEPIQLELF